jgi:DnaJ-class molecular chaperone
MKKVSITNPQYNDCTWCYGRGKIALYPITSQSGDLDNDPDERTCPVCCGSGKHLDAPITQFNVDNVKVPFTCPVCNGHGTVSKPPWVAGDQNAWGSTGNPLYQCPSCKGTCIIWGPPKE